MRVLGKLIDRDASKELKEQLFKVWKERFYIEPTDYAVLANDGAGESDWENIPAVFHLEIPASDPLPKVDSRGVPGLPTAIIHR